MKRIFLLGGLLLSLSLSYAQEETSQEWTVLDMQEEPSNLIARTNPVKDNNGNDCALLLINIPRLKKVKFEGNIMQQSDADGGEYKVYVTAGTKHITIKHDDFQPLKIDFGSYSINKVEGSVVYRIRVNVPRGTVLSHAFLTFEISPTDNVTLRVNGQTWPVSQDGIAQIKIDREEATYSVSREGCISETGSIALEKDTILRIHLKSEYGYVQSERMYPNTSVKISGSNNFERNFSSAFSIKLKAGTYNVEWKLPEFEPYYATIVIEPEQTVTLPTPSLETLRHSEEYFKRKEKEYRKESRKESRKEFFDNGNFIFSYLTLDVAAGTGIGGNVSILDAQYKYIGLSLLNIGYQKSFSFFKDSKSWYYAPTIRGFIPVKNDMAIVISAGAFCPYSLKEKDESEDKQSQTGTDKNTSEKYNWDWGKVNAMAEIGLQKYWGKHSCDFFLRYNGDYIVGVRYAINMRL